MKVFSKLPKELIHYILKYDDKIYYRNGEYINKIPKYDPRYKIIEPIPKRMRFYVRSDFPLPPEDGFSIYINFTNNIHVLIVQKYAYGKHIYYTFINKKNITINQHKTLL